MAKINILNQDLINQIAAGEVVERPASVVKELVENAIDAEATQIIVEICQGGTEMIKVTDNGCGMSREDAGLSIKQHATSKISSTDDLYKIASLGFRGEALASISSVSKFKLITKDKISLAGYVVEVENNEVKLGEIGAPQGTSIEVSQLFYNVPARQKYLKTQVTEFNHIVDLFLNFCLAYPEVAWKLIHNNKPVYQFPNSTLQTRISDVLGSEIANNLIAIDFVMNEIRVKGFIGKPQIARNNRKLQYLFINNRPVNEFIIAKQVKDAFSTLIPKDLYPVYIFNLQMNKSKVDVNVHPRKLEVRFSEPQLVYKTIYNAVSRMLDEHDLTMKMKAGEEKGFVAVGDVFKSSKDTLQITNNYECTNPIKNKQSQITNNYECTNPIKNKQSQITNNNKYTNLNEKGNRSLHNQWRTGGSMQIEKSVEFNRHMIEPVNASEPVKTDSGFEFTLLGQLQKSYILIEVWNGIKIYDQHATSERIQYEKIKRQWQIGKLASQKLLLPQNIELAPIETRALQNNIELLERLGFELEEMSNNTFTVSAVPQFLVNHDIKEVILEIVGDMTENLVLDDKISEPLNKIFNMMSCRSAIKFGDELSEEGMKALINDLEAIKDNKAKYTCVHGRPVAVEFSYDELGKMFKRI